MNVVLRVLRIELLQLARDKRALFSAIVLPALLYPALFWGMGQLESVGEKTMAERDLSVLIDLDALDDEVRGDFVEAYETKGPSTLLQADASDVLGAEEGEPRRLAARALMGLDAAPVAADADAEAPAAADAETETAEPERHDLLVIAETEEGPEGQRRSSFTLWYDVKRDDSREARSRAREVLRELESAEVELRRERLLGGDPARALVAEPQDLATDEESSGAALGKWLPFIALLVLVSGGAYAALAVFAGEREAGTLETLLVQPVPERSIATGKFLAVFTAGMATLVVNLLSLVLCFTTGLAGDEVIGGAGPVGLARLSALVLELPACLLLCAVLCLVCGGAKTFREGQMLVFPVTLLVIVPTAIVLRPDASLTALWALIPFAGSALALRDGLEGDLVPGLGALMVASHLGYTWLALTRVGRILDAEKILGGDAKADAHLRKASGRHAMGWGFAAVMVMYLVAGSVQRWNLHAGLWFTFWVFLPVFTYAAARLAPVRDGERPSLASSIGLRLPHPAHVVGALLLVPALALAARHLLEWQLDVLPLPGGGAGGDVGIDALGIPGGTLGLLFFLCISPGIMEELLFRGALLESMKRDWRWPRILAWQALYFGLIHLSVYRLLPTAILGALLAAVTLRARSVIPAILLHASYNGLTVFSGRAESDPGAADEWFTTNVLNAAWFEHAPWAAIVGVALLAFVGRSRD